MKKYLNLIKYKKNDLLAILILFLLSTLIFYFSTSKVSNFLIVYIKYKNNVYRFPLNEDRIVNLKNGNIVIEIKSNRVRVKKSDCPEKICVLTGWISKPNQIIVCIPNKLIVKIIGRKVKYDSISK